MAVTGIKWSDFKKREKELNKQTNKMAGQGKERERIWERELSK